MPKAAASARLSRKTDDVVLADKLQGAGGRADEAERLDVEDTGGRSTRDRTAREQGLQRGATARATSKRIKSGGGRRE
jgi:hypothetical protein